MSDRARQSAGWQVEQTASTAYEQYLVPAIFAPWADRLLSIAEVSDGDRVLDIGCGTGIVARRAASLVGAGGSVVGLDINAEMLAVAEDAAAGVHPSIEWRQGDATDLPFSNEEFDVVCSQQALQFVSDPVAVIEEMRRVLVPDGRMSLSVWRPLEYQPGYVILADVLERKIGSDAGAMMRSPFPSWTNEDLRSFAVDAGFNEVSVTIEIDSVRYPSVEEFVRREAASSPLAEQIAVVEPAVQDELVREVGDAMQSYRDDEGVVSPMELYTVTAIK